MELNKIKYLKIEDHLEPKTTGLYQIYVDKYWIVTEDNCIMLYNNSSYQCNSSEKIAKQFLKNYPNCLVKLIPILYFKE